MKLSSAVAGLALFAKASSAADVFMMGNSYTYYENMPNTLAGLLLENGDYSGTSIVDSKTSGGWKIYQHADQCEITGSDHANKLAAVNDFVIIHDQSQVPSCTCFTEYPASRAGIATIRSLMPAGADLILFQTWGRKLNDNNTFNTCYAKMQDNLRIGYEDYRLAARGTGAGAVYIAPVGYAFKSYHDDLCVDNNPPTCTATLGVSTGCDDVAGSAFEQLYAGDATHPSPRGSYLTACVLYATMTGRSPVGLSAPSNVPVEDVQRLQETACNVVLNDSQGLGYDYPWSIDGQSNPVNCETAQSPTTPPTAAPTTSPSFSPSGAPTGSPSAAPVGATTASPTQAPTGSPTPLDCSLLGSKSVCNGFSQCKWSGNPNSGSCGSSQPAPSPVSAPSPGGDCSSYSNKNSCNADPLCSYSNRDKVCLSN